MRAEAARTGGRKRVMGKVHLNLPQQGDQKGSVDRWITRDYFNGMIDGVQGGGWDGDNPKSQ